MIVKLLSRRRLLPLVFAAIAGIPSAFAQDPELSQFYAAPVYTNPAFAGAGLCGGRIGVNYRNQWPNLPGTFVTTNFSYDQHFDGISGGVGLMWTRDVAGQGLLATNSISGVYSYQLSLRKVTFHAGLQATIMQKSLDFDKLTFSDMINPTQGFIYQTGEPLPPQTKTFPNFSTGFLAYTEHFYAGFAVHNIIEPNQSFYNTPDGTLPRRFTVHTGAVIPLDKRRNPNATFSPNLLFMLQDKFTQINLGFYVNKGPLVGGLWFRQSVGYYGTSDAFMLLVGFRKDKFKFGYSYDLTVSDGRSAAPASHEISASIEWCNRKRPRSYKKLVCPQF